MKKTVKKLKTGTCGSCGDDVPVKDLSKPVFLKVTRYKWSKDIYRICLLCKCELHGQYKYVGEEN